MLGWCIWSGVGCLWVCVSLGVFSLGVSLSGCLSLWVCISGCWFLGMSVSGCVFLGVYLWVLVSRYVCLWVWVWWVCKLATGERVMLRCTLWLYGYEYPISFSNDGRCLLVSCSSC